jgi:hypothetical protein
MKNILFSKCSAKKLKISYKTLIEKFVNKVLNGLNKMVGCLLNSKASKLHLQGKNKLGKNE